MYLTHLCPICGKTHEMDCTPEPNQCCPACIEQLRKILGNHMSYAAVAKHGEKLLHEIKSWIEMKHFNEEVYHKA